MKYSKQILILMFFNLIIALVLIYMGHKTRNLELANYELIKKIENTKEAININEIEYAFHNNVQYLKKLYSLYVTKLDDQKITKIVTIKELKNFEKNNIHLVDY